MIRLLFDVLFLRETYIVFNPHERTNKILSGIIHDVGRQNRNVFRVVDGEWFLSRGDHSVKIEKRLRKIVFFLLKIKNLPIVVFNKWTHHQALKALMDVSLKKTILEHFDPLLANVATCALARFECEMSLEKTINKKAIGKICRDLRDTEKESGQKRIFFPDYCWGGAENTLFPWRSKPKLPGIHLAYCGNLEMNPASPVSFQYPLSRICAENGIHVHFFNSFAENHKLLQKYLQREKLEDFIHTYDVMPLRNMMESMTQCTAGIIVSSINVDHQEHDTWNEHHSHSFLCSKLFNYADAGLPSIVQNHGLIFWLVRRYRLGVGISSLEEVPSVAAKLKGQLVKIPTPLLLQTNIPRLIKWLESF